MALLGTVEWLEDDLKRRTAPGNNSSEAGRMHAQARLDARNEEIRKLALRMREASREHDDAFFMLLAMELTVMRHALEELDGSMATTQADIAYRGG